MLTDEFLIKTSLQTVFMEPDMDYKKRDHYKELTLDGKVRVIKHLLVDTSETQASISKGAGVPQGDLSKYLATDSAHRVLDKAIDYLFDQVEKKLEKIKAMEKN